MINPLVEVYPQKFSPYMQKLVVGKGVYAAPVFVRCESITIKRLR